MAFYTYAWFLGVIGGLLRLFVPEWGPLEFEVYARGIFTSDLDAEVMASMLNQYRFMKRTEFGFGLFVLLFRREIYSVAKFNAFFLRIVFLGASIQTLSLVVDGPPHPAYVMFTGIEFCIGLIVLI